MRYSTVCSGINSPAVAWDPLGWEEVFCSEIEPFPCAVLHHHKPSVPNLGDMTKFHEWPITLQFDLLAGGTPCQGFSVAGLRGGLDDPRSQLMLTYVEIAAKYRPSWLVWENVPGVFTSANGADFAALLGALTGRAISIPPGGWQNSGVVEGIPEAYGIAWRTLDAQYFGLAQRRRRVFIVGYLGDWRRAAAVLFERACLQGDPAPRRQTRKDVAPTLSACTHGGGGLGTDFDLDGGLVPNTSFPLCSGMAASAARMPHEQGALIPERARALTTSNQRIDAETETFIITNDLDKEVSGTLTKSALDGSSICGGDGRDQFLVASATPPLTGNPYGDHESREGLLVALQHMQVRRLTPRECERLQGFPDDYTLIPGRYRNRKDTDDHAETVAYLLAAGFSPSEAEQLAHHPDGPRYKALGNSMARTVMEWLGKRIQLVNNL